MNKSKINDFINIWAEVVGLTGEDNKKYINFIKTDIARRCEMYEKEVPTISTKDDSCTAYIIKPVNNQYSFEDFLLNRLMLGLREISFTGAYEGNAGQYEAKFKSLNIDTSKIISRVKDKANRHIGLQGHELKVAQKTVEHELGHCLKTVFNNGFKAPLGMGREQDETYKKLIKALTKFENGKYANQIKSLKDFALESYSDDIKTGVNDSSVFYSYDNRFVLIDEVLNETEALELTNSNEVHEIWALQNENSKDSSSGNYVNVYNYLSGYCSFTGYGPILKSLLGKENVFKAEYISSVDIFKQFDQEYADIVQDVWGLDPKVDPPIKCIFLDFHKLSYKKEFDENTMLKLDEFFAKCYERKFEKIMTKSNGNVSPEFLKATLNEIANFQSRLTTNDDPKKRETLVHNVIFENIKTKINERLIQNQQTEINENSKSVQQEDFQQKNSQFKQIDNKKMKFISRFIQAYDETETEYLYELRAKDEEFNIQRVQDIIGTNGFNRTLLFDLEGRFTSAENGAESKVQYSQKQVSAMARLLKASQLLTKNKNLNPEGFNYLEEFVSIPSIKAILKQMKDDLKDTDSYMFELKETAKANRNNGTLPNFPETPGEIDASDSSSTRSTSGQELKQEIGISAKQAEEIKQGENDARRREDEAKRKADEREVAKSNEESDKQHKKLTVETVKRDIFNSRVTTNEAIKSQKEIAERGKRTSLSIRAQLGTLSVEEQQRLNMLNAKYGEPEKAQRRSTGKRKVNGIGR